ncbi:MAG: SOS response-associated peptidase [Pirellulales bacterium]
MCGRFTSRVSAAAVAEAFGLEPPAEMPVRYNIAPSQPIAVVRFDALAGRRELAWVRWGLVPRWADDPAIGNRLINARAETVASKPAFRDAFRERRCLVVADGFYEWKKTGGRKQPYHLGLRQGELLAFAGLWDQWQRSGAALETATIVTTDANELVRPLHDRMPAIVAADDYDRWLEPDCDHAQLMEVLRPYPAERMSAHPVSTLVNNTANDVPECLEPDDRDNLRQMTLL